MMNQKIFVDYDVLYENDWTSSRLVFDRQPFKAFMEDIYPDETFETIMRATYTDEDIMEAKRCLDYEEIFCLTPDYIEVSYNGKNDDFKFVVAPRFNAEAFRHFMKNRYPDKTFETIMNTLCTSLDIEEAMRELDYREADDDEVCR